MKKKATAKTSKPAKKGATRDLAPLDERTSNVKAGAIQKRVRSS